MHNLVYDPIFIYFFLIISFHMDSMWNLAIPSSFHGIHMESTWNPHGIVEIISYGIHMDIPSFHVEFGHSITIPYGFQVEWRFQNEWDLSQNIFHIKWWIPYGIHME